MKDFGSISVCVYMTSACVHSILAILTGHEPLPSLKAPLRFRVFQAGRLNGSNLKVCTEALKTREGFGWIISGRIMSISSWSMI